MKAYRFLNTYEKAAHDGTGIIMTSLHAISHAQVIGFAKFDDDGNIIQNVMDPDDSPLFLIKVKPNKGTSFHIMTNGEVYYPVKGKTNLIYEPSLINEFGPLSEVDKMLICEAVRYYSSLFA